MALATDTNAPTNNRAEIYVQEQSPGVWVIMGTADGVIGKMPQRAFPTIRIDALKSEVDLARAVGTKFQGFGEYINNRLKTVGWTCMSIPDLVALLKP